MKIEDLKKILKSLKLNESLNSLDEIIRSSEQESLSYEEFLFELLQREAESKFSKKVTRILASSGLDLRKTMESFEQKRLDKRQLGQVKNLLRGDFLKRKENVLAFGNPGSGKTHLLTAVAQELVRNGHRVLFKTCQSMVEDLQIEKDKLRLSVYLKKLDRYPLIFLDDIGYVQKSREEMDVLFTLLAHRYERGSVMITSNLVFSQWDQIFKDPMTTAAVIDRMVHHSIILEMNFSSYRAEQAKGDAEE